MTMQNCDDLPLLDSGLNDRSGLSARPAESALFALRDSERACHFVRNLSGTCEDRGLHYFLLCDLNAWLTHEVTIARTFVHLFCACLPTPSEK